MKKIIVTLCSLALSLAGTFGINQLTSNDEAVIENNKQQVNIEQDADTVEKTDYADKANIEAKDNNEEKAIETEVSTPQAETSKNTKTNTTKVENTVKKDKSKTTKKEEKVVKEAVKTTDKKPVTNNNNSIAANNSQNKASDTTNNKANTQGGKGTATAPTTTPSKPTTTTPSKAEATPTPSKTTPSSASNSGSYQEYAQEVLRLVNIERSKAGLSALSTNTTLKAAADKRAREIKVSFSHTRPDGSKFSTALQEYGISYRTAGENIAYGQRTPQEVVSGWMNSPGHRANILNSGFGKIGIGVYQAGGVIYWTQLFTN